MTDDTSPENLRKFLESDDRAMVRMGISLAKGVGMKVTANDLGRFLQTERRRQTNRLNPQEADEPRGFRKLARQGPGDSPFS